jgi:formylglycine-generating enzyme required for sulfatase activity
MLSSWNRVRGLGRPPTRNLDAVQTMRVLAPLAMWMHEVNPGVGLVKREDLRRKLIDIYAERGETNPEAATTQFIDDVHEHAGLLLERGPGEYGFIHLTFEEYLAAVAIALQGQGNLQAIVDPLCAHVGDDAWREVALLAIGYLGIIQQLDRIAGDTVEQLIAAQRGAAGEAVVLAGEAVLDAQPGGVPPSSKQKVIEALIPAMQNAEVKPILRRKAGLLLGRLEWVPDDLDEFVEVPAGKFLYGDEKEEREISYRYWIAKYPVTNLQFKRFMDVKGYDNPQWWSAEGWSWRQGTYDNKADQVWGFLLRQRPTERRRQPYYWDDANRANSIFPVVGVCWFEAEAYAMWLDAHISTFATRAGQQARPANYVARLAREEEWERAARGVDGRDYPWIGQFDYCKANVAEEPGKGIGATAICTYPQGASVVDAWDMSGNVWEWTSTPLDKYRILRGGVWLYDRKSARCASVNRENPVIFDDLTGFRAVISQALPTS